jgi:hypothetical protein
MCNLEDFSSLALDEEHKSYVQTELEKWHRYYLPVGKTILDLGAGCGETAFFYLNHGAQRVICIEGNPSALKLLKENFGTDSRVVIVDAYVDSIKVDIEGAEEDMVIETHFAPFLKHLYTLPHSDSTLPGGVSIWRLTRMKHAFSLARIVHQERVAIAHRIRILLDGLSRKTA